MIVWGGTNINTGGEYLNDGLRYNPGTNSWIATSVTNAPTARYGHTAVWTGSEMIVWGGRGGAYAHANCNTNSDGRGYSYTYTFTNGDIYAPNTDRNCDSDSHTDRYSNGYIHCNTGSNCYGDAS